MSNRVEQAQVVSQAALVAGQGVTQLALFKPDGTPFELGDPSTKTEIVALTPVSATNAAAAAGANPTKAEYDVVVALANANKAAINAIIAALKA